MGTSKEGGGGAARQLSTQFSAKKILIELTDWKGDMLIVRWDDQHKDAWMTQHVKLSQESGPLPEVVKDDAGTSRRTRQVTVQEYIEERQRDEAWLRAQQTLPKEAQAPKSSKSSKKGKKVNAPKTK